MIVPLKFRSSREGSLPAVSKDRAYLDARDRLIGRRVQVDIPAGAGGPCCRGGYLRDLLPDRMARVECDRGMGNIWISLDRVALLGGGLDG